MNTNLKQKIIDERGPFCESGSGKRGHDLHHCLFRRNKRFAAYIDVEENYMLANHQDHLDGKFDTLEWRRRFWEIQCKRYGEEHMRNWIMSLPAKLLLCEFDFADWKVKTERMKNEQC